MSCFLIYPQLHHRFQSLFNENNYDGFTCLLSADDQVLLSFIFFLSFSFPPVSLSLILANFSSLTRQLLEGITFTFFEGKSQRVERRERNCLKREIERKRKKREGERVDHSLC